MLYIIFYGENVADYKNTEQKTTIHKSYIRATAAFIV